MDITQILSWIGTFLGMLIGIPQIIKSVRTKSTEDVSAVTFLLIFTVSVCFITRAIAIKEYAFILYYGFILISSSFQLFLIFRYRNSSDMK